MSDPLIGRPFLEYQVEARLGPAGLATNYKVRHRKMKVERTLQFLPAEAVSLRGKPETILGEAQRLGALREKNLARYFDGGSLDDGSVFLFLELLEGETLRARLRRSGPPPLRETLRIFRDLAEALVAAHEAGVLHRDLSPDGIVLARERGVDVTKLTDFGLALPLDGESLVRLHREQLTPSRPRYSSPEQLGEIGPGDSLDGRADLYTIGLLLHECLTGAPCFRGITAEEVLGARSANPAPPSRSTHRVEVPPALDALVMALLARDRGKRVGSAGELREALDAELSESHRAQPSRPAPRPAVREEPQPEAPPEARAEPRFAPPPRPSPGGQVARAPETRTEREETVFGQPPAAEGRAASTIKLSLPSTRVLLLGAGGVAVALAVILGLVWLARSQANRPSTEAPGTAAVALPAAAPAGPTLDLQRLESALATGDPVALRDWLRTFPRSGHRARAYRGLTERGVPAAEVCALVRSDAPELLSGASGLQALCTP